jgi:thioredoxin reductase
MNSAPSSPGQPSSPAQPWDVIVVGGGSAGLSAALTLGRSRRRVLVLDGGEPRNAVAAHMHGVLGHDGRPPLELLAMGREELARYGVERRSATASGARLEDGGVVVVADGEEVRARRLVVATGLSDTLPDVPGIEQHWGAGVVLCPYCDGWEHRDERIAVLATSPGSVGYAQLLRQWSSDLVFLTGDIPEPEVADLAGLAARGIQIERRGIHSIVADGDRLRGIELADGEVLAVDVIFTHTKVTPNDSLLRALGADLNQDGWAVVDASGRTSVPSVWAIGNLVSASANVPVSIAAGSMAGGAINMDLVAEDIALAIG